MRKALVIGAALSGTEVSKLLIKKGFDVFLTDSSSINNKEELTKYGIRVYENGHPEELKNIKYDCIVKNPGIKYDVSFVKYFVDEGYKILNEIEVASSFVDYKIAAITGTNGKTTVTTLLGEILKKKYGKLAFTSGNIGTPLSSIVLNHDDEKCYIALEISGFQLLGCPNFKPFVSTVLNLTPDHLDYYDTLSDYYDSKCLIKKNLDNNCYFLRNIDDKEIMSRCESINTNVIDYSLNIKKDIFIENGVAYYKDKKLFNIKDLKIVGKHNIVNAMVASTMALLMGVEENYIEETISEFKGIEHRIEFVKEINGVKYYNDSKGTNVDSTKVALEAFDKPIILLAGGHDKHTGFNEIIPYLNKIKYMFVFGETKNQLKDIYHDAIICNDMKEAIVSAKKVSREGDIVLLSPMCSSYDQFKNFEDRGKQFKDIVNSF